jgi:hypothetical protein
MHLRTNKVLSAHQDPSWYSCHNVCCFCLRSLVCFVAVLVVILGVFIFRWIQLSQRTYLVPKNHNTHLIKHESFKYREDWLILYDFLLGRATLPSDTKIFIWKYKPGQFYHYPVVEMGAKLFFHGKSFVSANEEPRDSRHCSHEQSIRFSHRCDEQNLVIVRTITTKA